jgi:hypothetical protein
MKTWRCVFFLSFPTFLVSLKQSRKTNPGPAALTKSKVIDVVSLTKLRLSVAECVRIHEARRVP